MAQRILVFAALARLAAAQCALYSGLYPFFGYGSSDCSTDPNDSSSLELVLLSEGNEATGNGCGPGGNIAQFIEMTVIYTGLDSVATSTTSTAYLPTGFPTITYDFNVPYTTLLPGAEVSLIADFANTGDLANPYVSYTFAITESFVSSLTTTTTTSTLLAETATITTTTSTVTVTDTVDLPTPTSTIPCTTGTSTVSEKAYTTTTTIVTTPPPIHLTRVELDISYTTASCLQAPVKKRGAPLRIRQEAEQFELPNCGAVTTTTYTATAYTSSTSTATVTSTTIDFATTTTTVTPTTTETVCSDVEATSTVTPTVTVTKHKCTTAPVIVSTKTIQVVETVLPRHGHPCSPRNAPKPNGGSGHGIGRFPS